MARYMIVKILLIDLLMLFIFFLIDEVINHGMAGSLLEELLNASKQFFAIPLKKD